MTATEVSLARLVRVLHRTRRRGREALMVCGHDVDESNEPTHRRHVCRRALAVWSRIDHVIEDVTVEHPLSRIGRDEDDVRGLRWRQADGVRLARVRHGITVERHDAKRVAMQMHNMRFLGTGVDQAQAHGRALRHGEFGSLRMCFAVEREDIFLSLPAILNDPI